MAARRISSNLTLFLKFFIPIFWLVFFGSLTVAMLFYQSEYIGNIPARPFRWGMLAFFLLGATALAFTLMRLKRVEIDEEYVYVTNYFKTYRYTFSSIEYIDRGDFVLLGLTTIHLRQKGKFGQRIPFIRSKRLYQEFMEEYPDIAAQLHRP